MYCRFPKNYLFAVEKIEGLVEFEELNYRDGNENIEIEEDRKHKCKCSKCSEKKECCNEKKKFEKEEKLFHCADESYVENLEKETQKDCKCKCQSKD